MLKNIIKMSEPVVSISTGKLRGTISESSKKIPYYSFRGIPYAKPPLGSLRFRAPEPVDPWIGVRNATTEGSDCIHLNQVFNKVQGTEDCLYLNVYTRKLLQGSDEKKPVMVWIHGGGFTSGSGSSLIYGPDFLLNEDIILVSVNYRLGILGFLSLEDPDLKVPGNAGLKDMVLALRWVQDNIVHFNGNPNNVTIFGESAGAAACHYLILSPLGKGLFHRAILQSGCALNCWASGRRCAVDVAKELNLQTRNEKTILKVLQELPVEDLYEASKRLPDPFAANFIRPFGPVIEKQTEGAFLTEHPTDIIKSGQYNNVPIIIGYTNREGMLSETFQKPKPFKPITDFEKSIPWFVKLEAGSQKSKALASRIKKFYYGDEEPSDQNKDQFYLLEGDNFFVRELLSVVKLHKKTMKEPIFLYRISVESDLNMMKNLSGITEPGVCHADDLGYLFKNPLTPDIEPGSLEEISIERFVKLWTSFAKSGDPNCRELDIGWKPVSQELTYLDIGTKLTLGVNPEADRMAFWQDILNVNPKSKI